MKLIADSGSTKTDWSLVDKNGESRDFSTVGLNPVVLGEAGFADLIKSELLPLLPSVSEVNEIYFFGAGCTPEQSVMVSRLFSGLFPGVSKVVVDSDLTGAAISLCGHTMGIACILGTGSNSCLYDGERILQNTPALGYILGDEGSGAVLGRKFLNAILKGQLPAALRDAFMEEYSLTLPIIINKVYREPLANKFLASISLFVAKHIDNQSVESLVVDNFRSFLDINVRPYYNNPALVAMESEITVNCVGSLAYHYENQLRKAAALEGMKIGRIIKSPIDGLKKYFF